MKRARVRNEILNSEFLVKVEACIQLLQKFEDKRISCVVYIHQ